MPVPKQRNQRKENEEIKQGKVPEQWQDNPNRLRQKDLNAKWTRKNDVSHYGYKKSISIDAAYGLIRRHLVTPANIHDRQMLPALLDGKNATAKVIARDLGGLPALQQLTTIMEWFQAMARQVPGLEQKKVPAALSR